MKFTRLLLAPVCAVLLAAPVSAAVITLTFEGAGDSAQLLNFYNGGTDNLGNSGTNYGISFGPNALSVIDEDAGGGGNFANEPSPKTTMFFLTGSAVLNYSPGFVDGFSFFYSSSKVASVKVYEGVNATGALLATINLIAQYNAGGCVGDPTGDYCNWTPIGASFAGIARSIDFGGTVNEIGYDNITFGSATPTGATPPATGVPEPATTALMALALVGFATSRRRRRF